MSNKFCWADVQPLALGGISSWGGGSAVGRETLGFVGVAAGFERDERGGEGERDILLGGVLVGVAEGRVGGLLKFEKIKIKYEHYCQNLKISFQKIKNCKITLPPHSAPNRLPPPTLDSQRVLTGR